MDGIGGFKGSGSFFPESKSEMDAQSLRQMRETDRKVRAHEQAHLSAAGDSAKGGMRLETKVGPDGKQYAVSGEVSIQVSGGRTPQEALTKAQSARRAALAPADPSPQDLKVAQSAAQAELEARRKLDETKNGRTPSGGYGRPASVSGNRVDLVA